MGSAPATALGAGEFAAITLLAHSRAPQQRPRNASAGAAFCRSFSFRLALRVRLGDSDASRRRASAQSVSSRVLPVLCAGVRVDAAATALHTACHGRNSGQGQVFTSASALSLSPRNASHNLAGRAGSSSCLLCCAASAPRIPPCRCPIHRSIHISPMTRCTMRKTEAAAGCFSFVALCCAHPLLLLQRSATRERQLQVYGSHHVAVPPPPSAQHRAGFWCCRKRSVALSAVS